MEDVGFDRLAHEAGISTAMAEFPHKGFCTPAHEHPVAVAGDNGL